MIWQEVKIYTTPIGTEMLSVELLGLGVAGWQVENPQDMAEYLNREEKAFDYAIDELYAQAKSDIAIMTFYLAVDSQGDQVLADVKSRLEELKIQDVDGIWGSLKLVNMNRDSEDWENNWKQYFKPFKVGRGLIIKPTWEECEPFDGRKILEIDPAGSFGTGQHYTTRLCMELLEDHLVCGDKILDLGCGTGILSIAGMLLGGSKVVAVDISEHSARTSKENAVQNGVNADDYITFWGDITSNPELVGEIGSGFDVITVNIVADVIIAMSGMFKGFIKAGGKVICSGIIDVRKDEVVAALVEEGFEILDVKEENGWVAMVVA